MKYLILVIEDNPDDKTFILRNINRIREAEYRCIEAEDGKTGLAAIRQHHPDCVLLDYSLPGHDGLEILWAIREMDALLPVIMLTGHGSESIAVQAMQRGAQNYLVKSNVNADILHRAILSRHSAFFDGTPADRTAKTYSGSGGRTGNYQ